MSSPALTHHTIGGQSVRLSPRYSHRIVRGTPGVLIELFCLRPEETTSYGGRSLPRHYQGKSTFVLTGYALEAGGSPSVEYQEVLSAEGEAPEPDGHIRLRFKNKAGEERQQTLQTLRWKLSHYPSGLDHGHYVVFEDLPYHAIWNEKGEERPAASFTVFRFVETPDVRAAQGSLVPDEAALPMEEEAETLRSFEVEEEIEEGEVERVQRQRWVYGFRVSGEGSRLRDVHVHGYRADGNGMLQALTARGEVSEGATWQTEVVLPRAWMTRRDGEVTTEQASYYFWLSRQQLGAARLGTLRAHLEQGKPGALALQALTPGPRTVEAYDGTGTALALAVVDYLGIAERRYAAFQEALERYEAWTASTGPLKLLNDAVRQVAESGLRKADEATAPSGYDVVQTPYRGQNGGAHIAVYEVESRPTFLANDRVKQESLQAMQRDRPRMPAWEAWRVDYARRFNVLRSSCEVAAAALVALRESIAYQTALRDLEAQGSDGGKEADLINGITAEGLSATEAGQGHLERLYMRYMNGDGEDAERWGPLLYNPLNALFSVGRKMTKGMVKLFAELPGAVAQHQEHPTNSARVFARMMKATAEIQEDVVEEGVVIKVGDVATVTPIEKRITLDLRSWRYEVDVDGMGPRVATLDAALARRYKVGALGVLELANVFRAALHGGAVRFDIERGLPMSAATASLSRFAVDQVLNRQERALNVAEMRLKARGREAARATSARQVLRQRVVVHTTRRIALGLLVVGAALEVASGIYDMQESAKQYDFDGRSGQFFLTLGSLFSALSAGSSFSGKAILLGPLGWMIAAVGVFGIGAFLLFTARSPLVQWLERTHWGKEEKKEWVTREAMLKGQEGLFAGPRFIKLTEQAQEQNAKFSELADTFTVNAQWRNWNSYLPILAIEINAAIMGEGFYFEVDPAIPNGLSGDSSTPLAFRLRHNHLGDMARAGTIRVALYDAEHQSHVARLRSRLQSEFGLLRPMEDLKMQIRSARREGARATARVVFSPFGLVDQVRVDETDYIMPA